MAAAHLRCSHLWLRHCTSAQNFAPLTPANVLKTFAGCDARLVAPLSTRFFSSGKSLLPDTLAIDAHTLAKKLMQQNPEMDPANATMRDLEMLAAKLPGVDSSVVLKGELQTAGKEWAKLYEFSCFDDLLDSDMDVHVGSAPLRPDLEKRNAEEVQLYEEAASQDAAQPMQDAKQAKAQRFQQFAKAEEESLAEQVLETATREVNKEATEKIAAINWNAKKLIQEVEIELKAKIAKIKESLKPKAPVARRKVAAGAAATSPTTKKEAEPSGGTRPKWGGKWKS